jgi:uncharacterized membrane-anchored protein
MKIAATTLGETAGDLLAQTMKVGYLVSSAILVGLFLLTLVTQLRVRGFHPALYWTGTAPSARRSSSPPYSWR